MAPIKQEKSDEDAYSDQWLRDSVEVKEEEDDDDVKPSYLPIKCHTHVSQNGDFKDEKLTKTTSSTLEEQSIKENVTKNCTEQSWKASMQERIIVAPVSDSVGNLCQYRCPKCHTIYSLWDSLYRHLKETRHALPTRTIKSNTLVKIVAHNCFICSKKVLCDRPSIRNHLRQHKMRSIKEYVDKTKATLIKGKIKCQLGELHKKLNSKYKLSENIGYLCRYKCEKCDFSCSKWMIMRQHIKIKRHELKAFSSILRYLHTASFHRCRMCEELILCDTEIAGYHLKKRHQITVNKYRAAMLKIHTSTFQEYMIKLKTAIQDIPIVKTKQSNVLKVGSLPDHMTTGNMGNLSFFRCKDCNKSGMSFASLRSHYTHSHNLKRPALKYDSKLVVEARFHKCHICSRLVMCDNYILGEHLKNSHKLTLSQYKKELVLRKGFRFFPSYHEYAGNNYSLETSQTSNNMIRNTKDKDDLILPHMLSSESEDSDKET